jgi:predicted nucleic acid-binding protein
MVILIDSNVVLDFMLKNEDFCEAAEDVLVLTESGEIEGYVSASAVTDIFYVARKALGDKTKALNLIRNLLAIVHVAAVDEGVIHSAMDLDWGDFEDAVQYSAGARLNVEYIVTRDLKGFAESGIKTVTPRDLLMLLSANSD